MKPKIQPLPCPFCGGKAVIHIMKASPPEILNPVWTVDCQKSNPCPVWPSAFGDSRAEAIAAWNTRKES